MVRESWNRGSRESGRGNEEPIVQRWMPAASVYFLDCDGNKLEFISMLHDDQMN